MFAGCEYEAILRAGGSICIAPGIDRLLLIQVSYEAS